jgi:hypothetical protein
MNRSKTALVVGALVAFLVPTAARADSNGFSFFSVGNSLTLNSDIQAVLDEATLNGFNVNSTTTNQNIRSGQGLDVLWRAHVVESGVSYTTAFSNPYNAITLEPFGGPGLSGPPSPGVTDPSNSGDINRALNFMQYADGLISTTPPTNPSNPANANAQFYIFARWSEHNAWSPGYDEAWTKPYTTVNDPNFLTTETSDYFLNNLMPALRAQQPQSMKPVELIPTGFVFDAIDKKLRSESEESDDVGIAPTERLSSLLYGGDNLHANGLYGDLVASLTFYSTMFHTSPVGIQIPWQDFSLDKDDPQVQARVSEFESIIWDVVQDTPFTGVPEPTSLGIIGAGCIMMLRHRRRQRAGHAMQA